MAQKTISQFPFALASYPLWNAIRIEMDESH